MARVDPHETPQLVEVIQMRFIDADVFSARSPRATATDGGAVVGARSRMVDFGDPEAMAGLRARVLGVLQLVAAALSGIGVFMVPAFRASGAAPYAISEFRAPTGP